VNGELLGEAIDTAFTLARAYAAWIVIGGLAVSALLLVVAWAVKRIVKGAWRLGARWARRGAQAPVSRPQSPTYGSRDADTPPEPSQAPSKAPGYREAVNPAEAEQQRLNALHHVSGRVIDCCETDETDCPCICHDTPPADLIDPETKP